MSSSRYELRDVTVVIPLYNGRDLIEDCLRSVSDSVGAVIVTDDGSTDDAPDLAAMVAPDATILRSDRNGGFGTNVNRGLRAASTEICVVLNSDARLTPGALEAIVGAFSDDESVGIVGLRNVFPDGSHQVAAARFPTPMSIVAGSFLLNELFRRLFPTRRFPFESGLTRSEHERSQDVDWVVGTCLGIRRACVEDTKGFDEEYFMYAEETDLCLRAERAGWRVRYVADGTVIHIGAGSTGDPRVHARRSLPSEARFMTLAHGPAVIRRWRTARIVGAILKLPLLAVPAVFDQRVRERLVWQWTALGVAVRWRPQRPDSH